jgi:hypothetical protein
MAHGCKVWWMWERRSAWAGGEFFLPGAACAWGDRRRQGVRLKQIGGTMAKASQEDRSPKCCFRRWRLRSRRREPYTFCFFFSIAKRPSPIVLSSRVQTRQTWTRTKERPSKCRYNRTIPSRIPRQMRLGQVNRDDSRSLGSDSYHAAEGDMQGFLHQSVFVGCGVGPQARDRTLDGIAPVIGSWAASTSKIHIRKASSRRDEISYGRRAPLEADGSSRAKLFWDQTPCTLGTGPCRSAPGCEWPDRGRQTSYEFFGRHTRPALEQGICLSVRGAHQTIVVCWTEGGQGWRAKLFEDGKRPPKARPRVSAQTQVRASRAREGRKGQRVAALSCGGAVSPL